VLRDPVTREVRAYGAAVPRHATGADAIGSAPAFAQALAALHGEPMLRAHVACHRAHGHPSSPEPAHAHFLGRHEDGCPIYDPHRPSAPRSAPDPTATPPVAPSAPQEAA